MKVRTGFVSNSSSASFVISIGAITGEQMMALLNHATVAGKDAWEIIIENGLMTGKTSMDNFDMYAFMTQHGIDPQKARWFHS